MAESRQLPKKLARALDTPIPVVDLAVAKRNIERLQHFCDIAGVGNRPHIKTHKSIEMARLQVESGAIGITCQKIGEAEVMADAGFDNILVSYNIVGDTKLRRLAALASRTRVTVSCDSNVVADGLSHVGRSLSDPLAVLVECDTGRRRCGLSTVGDAVALAAHIRSCEGLRFAGLLVHPPDGGSALTGDFVSEVMVRCGESGLTVETVSSGGTPNIVDIGRARETEFRSGTSIYNDRQMVNAGAADWADCALYVYATVVSRPDSNRMLIDAGSKSLTSDLAGFDDFGMLVDYPRTRIYKLAEEHGFVDISRCIEPPAIGEVVRVLPNHVCPVSNLFDRVLVLGDAMKLRKMSIDARGKVS